MAHIAKAIEQFDALAVRCPLHAPAFCGRGLAHRKRAKFLVLAGQDPLSDWRLALADFDEATRLEKYNVHAAEQSGWALFERAVYVGEHKGPWRADAEAAWARFDEVLKLDSTSLDGRLGRGFAALIRTVFGSEWLDRAIADFSEAVRAAPRMPRARVGLGDAFRQARRWKEAAAEYERAIELDPALREPYGPVLEECRAHIK